ncbi:hypothetical protein, partial [Streptomyces novaecaesareae]|uniref:hypothetical protein n=1 Tax=Streptomyces novaecaesareae TaxID=68244 RepID=UPI001ADEF016
MRPVFEPLDPEPFEPDEPDEPPEPDEPLDPDEPPDPFEPLASWTVPSSSAGRYAAGTTETPAPTALARVAVASGVASVSYTHLRAHE